MNIAVHKKKTGTLSNIYRPDFFRLQKPADKERFTALIDSGPLFLHDEIFGQLGELLKCRHPSRQLSREESEALIAEHTGPCLDEYGVWVYYPWNARLVHLLDKEEFAEVRTSRNKYKITSEEQALLSSKKVGVIGLSVGQSVAVTMAMERSFGEIRLADFDILELTNLNRIRTGLSNLGLKKVIAVAREIAEIDPFLRVTIFDEGLTEENMDTFFTGGGVLDAVIDECDGIDIKIACRQKARELGVPVLMEASDKCTIDVERFDLEPSRSLLHGYIDHLDISRLKHLKTNEEKIPYLAPMVGIDTMSARLKASALEVGHSITTWPQLASAVVMGGGALGDIWRRIALDQFRESGRYFIDMEELTGNKTVQGSLTGEKEILPAPLTVSGMAAGLDRYLSERREATFAPPEHIIRELVRAAGMAPSGGNSQPWKWVYKKGTLFLFLDKQEAYSYMNFRDTASYIALGAAIENLVLKAEQYGLRIKGDYFPLPDNDSLTSAFSFHESSSAGEGVEPVVEGAWRILLKKGIPTASSRPGNYFRRQYWMN
ncbi:Rv1355c family protein [Anseongella ginsenosidimutans]|uniref:Rv1355c family protein n=1 Tax=Anseongella ginsenosidimutans TaxID=496056 RepID=UPI0011C8D032|nr:Rv1355c family protein [Anseongella ginsenosidimutans]QEC53957.1 Rv1355c family protein [Anseongella ginsenosidimutans]